MGSDEQVLGQGELALAKDGVGNGQKLLGPALRRIGDIPLAGHGQQQRMHAGGVDGMHLPTPLTTVGIRGPVNSWIKAPKLVSSWGGRPTVVKGQMASRRW